MKWIVLVCVLLAGCAAKPTYTDKQIKDLLIGGHINQLYSEMNAVLRRVEVLEASTPNRLVGCVHKNRSEP